MKDINGDMMGDKRAAELVRWLTKFKKNAVLICRDISAGIVPMDAEQRAWREAVGRYLSALAADADTVTRVFCGLPQQLK